MLTTLSIFSRDQGKIWSEPYAASTDDGASVSSQEDARTSERPARALTLALVAGLAGRSATTKARRFLSAVAGVLDTNGPARQRRT